MVDQFSGVFVDLAKLTDYCLSESHPRGRHKARAFRITLGIDAKGAAELRNALLEAVRIHESDLRPAQADDYGRRYVLDFAMTTSTGSAMIRSAWIVRTAETILRLTSCYVLQEQP